MGDCYAFYQRSDTKNYFLIINNDFKNPISVMSTTDEGGNQIFTFSYGDILVNYPGRFGNNNQIATIPNCNSASRFNMGEFYYQKVEVNTGIWATAPIISSVQVPLDPINIERYQLRENISTTLGANGQTFQFLNNHVLSTVFNNSSKVSQKS
jgi:hypothetical protein